MPQDDHHMRHVEASMGRVKIYIHMIHLERANCEIVEFYLAHLPIPEFRLAVQVRKRDHVYGANQFAVMAVGEIWPVGIVVGST